jgi:hypothetical protein
VRSSRHGEEEARDGLGAVAGSIDLLSKRARGLVLERVELHEHAASASWLCLVGESGDALVALPGRLLVVKPRLGARLTLSDEIESFDCSDIDEIGLVVGEVNSVIEVRSSARQGAEKEWWQARNPSDDPFRAMNSIVIRTARLGDYEAPVEELRRRVAEGAGAGAAALVSSLERLATLHASGSLSDEEFERAKRKLLG